MVMRQREHGCCKHPTQDALRHAQAWHSRPQLCSQALQEAPWASRIESAVNASVGAADMALQQVWADRAEHDGAGAAWAASVASTLGCHDGYLHTSGQHCLHPGRISA